MAIEFGILGPVQAVRDGAPLPLGGPRQRSVLARLLVSAGRVVPLDVLISDVWDGEPPPTAAVTIQKYVSQLRKGIGHSVLRTVGRGYSIEAPREAVDAQRFEDLLSACEYDEALALWRGEALADLPDVLFVVAERTRLDELHLVAIERRLDAELAAGHHLDVVPALQELSERHPLREHLCGLLMLALYRSGRQADALGAYRLHHERLVDEIGVDPADDLVALQQAILRHDSSLRPPPRSAPARPAGNLRPPISSFVDRDTERRLAAEALHRARLVTLVGPGGVGKTRLAVEVGARMRMEYAGGVWLVDLAGVNAPGVVADQVAATLGLVDQPGQRAEATVQAALEHRDRLLLIMDNCEHLLEASAKLVDRIVRECANVHVCATSRRPLGVDGEHVVTVAPLPDHDASRLFADRARLAGMAERDIEVCGIWRWLDGLPLALELAASQLRLLGTHEIAARVDERLQFVSGRYDVAPRHRTLRDMVEWSHALLPPPTRQAFARLGVFAATFAPDAASAVCDDEEALAHLTTLVDHSLLVREPGPASPVRFRMLETIRLHALEKLREIGQEYDARRAHAAFFLELAEAAGPHLYGPDERVWADRLESEDANLQAALAWAAEQDHLLALRLGVALRPYWDFRWQERHAVAALSSVLDATPRVPDELRAWTLTTMADLSAYSGDVRLAGGWAEAAVQLFRTIGEDRGLAAALVALGSARRNEGLLDAADTALGEALTLAHGVGDGVLVAAGLSIKGFVATLRADPRHAEELRRAELAAWAALGSRRGEAHALRHLAVALQHLGELDQATQCASRALAIWEELGNGAAVAHVQSTQADIARLRGDIDEALGLYDEAFAVYRAIGDRRCTASTYKNLAVIAHARGSPEDSTALFVNAVRIRHELGDYAGLAECFDGIARNLAERGRPQQASRLLWAAEERRSAGGSKATPEEIAVAASVRAQLHTAVGQLEPLEPMSLDEVVELVLALAPTGTGKPPDV